MKTNDRDEILVDLVTLINQSKIIDRLMAPTRDAYRRRGTIDAVRIEAAELLKILTDLVDGNE
jgi:hypothetical protein